MPKQPSTASRFETLTDTISDALSEIEGLTLDSLGNSKAMVDITARLNTQIAILTKIIEPAKASLKAEGVLGLPTDGSPGDSYVRGESYKATVRRVKKQTLDTERVKVFLGKRLASYLVSRAEVQILFGILE